MTILETIAEFFRGIQDTAAQLWRSASSRLFGSTNAPIREADSTPKRGLISRLFGVSDNFLPHALSAGEKAALRSGSIADFHKETAAKYASHLGKHGWDATRVADMIANTVFFARQKGVADDVVLERVPHKPRQNFRYVYGWLSRPC